MTERVKLNKQPLMTETELKNAVNRTQKVSVCHHGQSAVLGIPMNEYASSYQRDFGPEASTNHYSGNVGWSQ